MNREELMDLTDRAFAIYYDFVSPGLAPCTREGGDCIYLGTGEVAVYCGHFHRPCFMSEVPR